MTAFYVILSVAEESQKIAIRFFVTNVPQNDRKNSYHSKCITRILKIKIATGPFATLRVTAFYVILSVAEESQSIAIRFFVTNVPQND